MAQDRLLLQNGSPSFVRSDLEKKITPFLHPFITTDAYRDVNETILLKGQTLEIWRLDNLETGAINTKLCQTVRHLLFGRLNQSLGIQTLFKRNAQIQEIQWILYRVKTQVTPSLNNQYQQTRQPVSVAKVIISRRKALLFNAKRLKKMLKGQVCLTTAHLFVDEIWISDRVKTRRQQIARLNAEINAQKLKRQKAQISPQRVGSKNAE
jgi:hypothetical protein